MQKRILFLISLFILLLASCHRVQPLSKENTDWISREWMIFDYPEMNGRAYLIYKHKKVKGIICADIQGIQGRVCLSHPCNQEEYLALKEKFEKMGARYLGKTKSPDIKEYPDLSAYLTFIMSDDEMHQLWRELGLE